MTDAAQIAAFLAARGVTKVPAGERTLSERDMYQRVRGEPTVDHLISERRTVVDHCGRERVRNGLGEWIA
jgi:hypothetical protein